MKFRKINKFFSYILIFVFLANCWIFFGIPQDSLAATPNDQYYKTQWYLDKIKALSAWDIASRSPHITIAVIDSGIQIDHPDLKNNIWQNSGEIFNNGIDDDGNGFIDDVNGWDFINNTPDPSPRFEKNFTEAGIIHGTLVASIAAASGNNAAGIAGVTWQAKIMPLRVLNDRGEGKVTDVVRAIDYAINNGADIINLSFVGFNYSQGLEEAVTRAYKAGVIIVAAAGNELEQGSGYNLDKNPMYPVCYDGKNGENMIIGVAATDAIDQKTAFSSYGFRCVDIMAPGVSVFGASVYAPNQSINKKFFTNYYDGYWSGTSMATPMVAGAIALIKEMNPELKFDEIRKILLSNSENIYRLNPNFIGQLGAGRLNVKNMVEAVSKDMKLKSASVIISPQFDLDNRIKFTSFSGAEKLSFSAFDKNFRGGVNIASGDINGDEQDEIITGAGAGGGPHIKVFDQQGKLILQFFAFDKNFRGGVNVASGDLDGDGKNEIITGAGTGGLPQIKIFDRKGKLIDQFYAFDKSFRGGVNVASGDLDGDGKNEIIVGAGGGSTPQVKIFNRVGKLIGQFYAFDKSFRGGVNVAAGNVIWAGRSTKDEIIVAPAKGGSPHVRVLDGHAKLLAQFYAYDKKFNGGVNIGAGDINNDGMDEIITGAGEGGSPHARIFDGQGVLLSGFYAFDVKYNKGIRVGVIKNKVE
ncbi:MAG: S8 family serine peptidase [Patescibacteria group bacterium]|nr:S8 family serine peptidase [Patescibacteria group bacterium]MDD4610837.1 S8 family serine peptidase [Patescibacteria group bacterium]